MSEKEPVTIETMMAANARQIVGSVKAQWQRDAMAQQRAFRMYFEPFDAEAHLQQLDRLGITR